jgi:group I intron endonuclease
MIIYLITNKINGKQYVGQTTRTLSERMGRHKASAYGVPKHAVGRAIAKHGFENFGVEILAEANTREELDLLEIKFIEECNTLVPNGYNLAGGGHMAKRKTHDETKKKLSEVSNKYWSDSENRKSQSEISKARWQTEDYRQKILATLTSVASDRSIQNQKSISMKVTCAKEEVRKKKSETMRKRLLCPEQRAIIVSKLLESNTKRQKPVRGINKNTGEVIEFPSISATSKAGFIPAHVSKSASSKFRKVSSGGHYWEFLPVLHESEKEINVV